MALVDISIHAPLAGCDCGSRTSCGSWSHFNPRTPCGVRPEKRGAKNSPLTFQSTHPSRGATDCVRNLIDAQIISIHAPLVGCDAGQRDAGLAHAISIHAPLAGCDWITMAESVPAVIFQSTHPLRGATLSSPSPALPATHFNPRTPCGVRPALMLGMGVYFCISIHAPLAGCDSGSRTSCGSWSHFNPRTPRGVRLRQRRRSDRAGHISIHAPLAGCDVFAGLIAPRLPVISIHAPLAGCPFFPGGISTHRRRRTHPVSGKKCAYPG